MRTPSVPVTDVDAAFEYVDALRTDPRGANPDGWRVDWDDGPWPVKVYAGGRRTRPAAALNRLLANGLAITTARIDQRGALPTSPEQPVPIRRGAAVLTRRAVPSGGAMYPTEAYVVTRAAPAAYHYDPYRHELLDLAHPAPLPALADAVLLTDGVPAVTVVLGFRFWKNFYKYGDFAYRLGALDVGVVVGRLLRLGAAGFGRADLLVDFDDRRLNALLGLDGEQESCYAVLCLGDRAPVPDARVHPVSAPPVVVERSSRVRRSARFAAAHTAASAGSGVPPAMSPSTAERIADVPVAVADPLPLPEPAAVAGLDPAVLVRRTSNGHLFTGRPAPASALATVLRYACDAIAGFGLRCADPLADLPDLYCAVNRVSGVPAGWYRVALDGGCLVPVGAGGDPACGRTLQRALFAGTVNLELAAFTVHVASEVDFRGASRGVREYRVRQMAAGVAVEAVTVACVATGLGSHPLLGFDANVVDDRYGLPGTGRGVQIQIAAGPVRPAPTPEVPVRHVLTDHRGGS
ncbi:MAG TPA: SagB family peptide dehydrogenase [Pseudonocardiaceae bacterium]|nr:SagB family peptide dehydrogenase [Pseudonocardiaceae bacterium]